MVDIFKEWSKEEEIYMYYLINKQKIQKIQKIYNLYTKKKIKYFIDLNIKGINFRKVLYNTPDKMNYAHFIRKVELIYKLYILLKKSKSFEELIFHANKITFKNLIFFGTEDKYFNNFKKKFEEMPIKYIQFFIIARILNIKPQKKFKNIFKKCIKKLNNEKILERGKKYYKRISKDNIRIKMELDWIITQPEKKLIEYLKKSYKIKNIKMEKYHSIHLQDEEEKILKEKFKELKKIKENLKISTLINIVNDMYFHVKTINSTLHKFVIKEKKRKIFPGFGL